jgi:hypothetical protein
MIPASIQDIDTNSRFNGTQADFAKPPIGITCA